MIAGFLTPAGLVALVPLLAAALAALAPRPAIGAWLVILASAASFALATRLPWLLGVSDLLLVDRLSAHMALLTSFVGFTTAVFSRGYVAIELASGRIDAARLRQYHALFLAFLGFMLLAILSNNLGVTWVAMEAATIAAVLVVGLPRTGNAVEASWKFFILCGVGIALALFGTIVLYLAARPALGAGLPAMSWSALAGAAPRFQAPMLNLAFVFLLIGYGTKAGLAPLHAWMPDAHAEGPTPVSAVLSGSILNVALLVILRLRGLLAVNAQAVNPAIPIMALGLLSLLFAALSLYRRRDIKRFFAFSTIEQSGIAAFALGLGGPAGMFAGLLHITLHTLTKAAVFQCVGRIAQAKGSQLFADVTGLLASHRALALTFLAGLVALAGLPPFGLFASEYLVFVQTARLWPWLLLPFGLGLVLGFWALASRGMALCLGAPSANHGPGPHRGPGWTDLLPAWLHLALVVGLGLAMPGVVFDWFSAIAGAQP